MTLHIILDFFLYDDTKLQEKSRTTHIYEKLRSITIVSKKAVNEFIVSPPTILESTRKYSAFEH